MLSVIVTQDAQVRDAFISSLSLEKHTEGMGEYSVYKRGKWILVFNAKKDLEEMNSWTLENFIPERLYLPFFGDAVDIVHEIGDIVLPNVFLTYNPRISTEELDKENRDRFLDSAKFLETYHEQKDYYVEDYGLSIGGIVVDSVSNEADAEKLMLAYEADVYLKDSIAGAYEIALREDVPTIIACGITTGKQPKNITLSPLDHTVRNMVGTFRLLQDE